MRNVKIAYLLSFLWRSWFWLGCWVFYYLRYTDYAGIGFLETVMITTATLGEIPTGAIADIFGKKISVSLAFFLGMVGNIIMAVAPNYWILVISIITMTIGGAFYSGSLEALVYDTLKDKGEESKYQKILGRITTMQNLGMAVAGIVGGYLYQINASLPFLCVAAAYLIGLIASLWVTEPQVDSERYSWKVFVSQNIQGFKQLFVNKRTAFISLLLLVPASFMIATENVLNDASAVELGFDSVKLGIFVTIMYIFGVLVSEKTDWLMRIFKSKWLFAGSVSLYAITLLLMPKLGFYFGALILLIRYGVQTFFSNYESVRINEIAESKYRATTLSTFSLLRNIPYVLTATGIGFLMNLYTAKLFSLYFGLLFVGSLAAVLLVRPLFRVQKS